MARKHNLEEVLRSLGRKQDLNIVQEEKIIYVLENEVLDIKTGNYNPNPKKSWDIGNGSWGKMDYLTSVHGYTLNLVNELPRKRR